MQLHFIYATGAESEIISFESRRRCIKIFTENHGNENLITNELHVFNALDGQPYYLQLEI